MRRLTPFAAVCFLFLMAGHSTAQAPGPCPTTPALMQADPSNMFNDLQENDLGDAISERMQREIPVVTDDAANAFLQRTGDRLLQQLPKSLIHFRFILVEQSEVNAFSFPGGRIYVTRKLVAAANSEDELAGVLAHEIGHIITHQSAIQTSLLFRTVLGINAVTDRKDIFERLHQFMDTVGLKAGAIKEKGGEESRHQKVADDVALYAMAKAGYKPASFSEFWDRIAETQGKTGGKLSDFFGTTKPESKRLRQMLKTASSLPAECLGPAFSRPAEFKAWQILVINYSFPTRTEALQGVLFQKALDPPLRSDLQNIRFSPNGRLLLAQDDASIFVINRDPLQVLFRIDAREAEPAQFSPDSQFLSFFNTKLRIETWNVAEQKRQFVQELVVPKGCMQIALSATGKTLSCLTRTRDLLIFDVESGTEIFRKLLFYVPDIYDYDYREMADSIVITFDLNKYRPFIGMEFSPDGKYLLAGRSRTTLGFDVAAQKQIPLPGRIKEAMARDFVFLSPDRLVGANPSNSLKSFLVRFPSGESIAEVKVSQTKLGAPAHGDYIMLRPLEEYGVAVLELATGKPILANKLQAIDIYDDVFASQRKDGELALSSKSGKSPFATLALPRSPLSTLRATAISPDLNYLAVSERNRGAVWDLQSNSRILHLRGFQGAYIGKDKLLYADFPKQDKTHRAITKFELATGQDYESFNLGEENTHQDGPFLVTFKPKKKGYLSENGTMELKDVLTGSVVWTRNFPNEVPEHAISPSLGTMVLRWTLKETAAKNEIKADPELSKSVAAMGNTEEDYLLVVVDVKTGKTLSKILIETGKGSFRLKTMIAAGDTLIVSDSSNRILIYSLKDGKQKAHAFGEFHSVSRDGTMMAIQNEKGVVSLLDTSTLRRRYELRFANDVALTDFSEDGKRLFVLTRDQTAWLIDLTKQKELSAEQN